MAFPQTNESTTIHTGLKRTLSLPMVVFYGLGNILGAGIYVLIGKVAGEAGQYTPLAFLLSSMLVVATAFSYAELVSRYPRSAGEAVYVQQGFGIQSLSTAVGLLICVAGIVSSAALVKGFVGYLEVLVPVAENEIIIVVSITLGLIAAWGISQSVKIIAIVTVLEIFGLLFVIAAGFNISPAELPTDEVSPAASWSGIWYGAFLAFYAFLGFEDMVNVAEEVKRPRIYLPVAIIIALILATLLYVSVSFVAVRVMTPGSLAASGAPLAAIVSKAIGFGGGIIAVIGLLAVINGALVQIIMSSRVIFGLARQGWIPAVFDWVWPVTRTPVLATAVTAVCVAVMALSLPIVSLAAMTSLLVLIVFSLVNVSLIRIKKRGGEKQVLFEVPLWVPVAGVAASLGLALFSLTTIK